MGFVGPEAHVVGGEAQFPGAPAAQGGEKVSTLGKFMLLTQWSPLSLAYSDFRNKKKTKCLLWKVNFPNSVDPSQ